MVKDVRGRALPASWLVPNCQENKWHRSSSNSQSATLEDFQSKRARYTIVLESTGGTRTVIWARGS